MTDKFKHGTLNLTEKNKLIFTSYSKKYFYLRAEISAFILKQNETPISPFMNFDYNLGNLVPKDFIRIANNTLIQRSDEVWVFGAISDGVLIEIYLGQKYHKPIRFFTYREDQNVFECVERDQVILEDVSPWMWTWINQGKKLDRWHPRLRFQKTYPLIYPAYSKRNFFWQMHISQFCLNKKRVPLNPFMLFRYFLGDSISRESVYLANNNIVRACDEVWVFGEVSNGVLAEIKMKKEQNQPVKYFKIAKTNPVVFRQILPQSVKFEIEETTELEPYRHLL